ncbi:hypothetical protein BJV82DRAFT_665500 [Fennellomyces sp. T-0311]|nr:hypothetical protein BJV82DRAFT_665500 [Fennellomyces sp. T-0311]
MSTNLIYNLQQQMADALKLRAPILEKKSNLTEELKDALQVMQQEELQKTIDFFLKASWAGPEEGYYSLKE